MISLKDVLDIHEKLIFEFGGAKGIRDNSSYEMILEWLSLHVVKL